jgi:hypothetical protein
MVIAALTESLYKIGALTGILAIIGTGLLILLVAAQSREVRKLRDWVAGEPERMEALKQSTITEVQRRIAQARERRAAAAAGAGATVPPRPATPGTAISGAAAGAAAVSASGSVAPPAAGAPSPLFPPAGSTAAPLPPVGADAASPEGGPRFAPLTPAAGAESTDDEDDLGDPGLDPGLDPSAIPVGEATMAAPPPVFDDPPSARAASRSGRTIYSDDDFDHHEDDYDYDEESRDNSRRTRWLFGIGGLVLVAGIVILLLTLLDGNGGAPVSTNPLVSTPKTTQSSKTKAKATVPPADVTVGVYNGTSINGLGSKVQSKIANADYNARPAQTAPGNGTPKATTTVAYKTGYRNSALAIAKLLDLPTSAVQPITSDVSIAAGADVVVTVGNDLSSLSTTGTTGSTGTTG